MSLKDAASQLTRIEQWWDFKMQQPLAAIFALALQQGLFADKVLGLILLLLICGLTAGTFASLVNDFTDLEIDKKAGKIRLIAKFPPICRLLALVAVCFLCLGNFFLLLPNPAAGLIYLSICLVFTCYSIRPFRFKERGFLGAIAIAFGEHLLPTMLAIALVPFSSSMQPTIIAALAVWSFCFGLRGIFWHQIADESNDKSASCRTAAVELGTDTLVLWTKRFVFPVEVAAVLTILICTKASIVWLGLGLYFAFEYLQYRYMKANLILVKPAENARFIMFEYYQLFLPLALLFTCSRFDSTYLWLSVFYLMLFAKPAMRTGKILLHLARWRFLPAARALVRPSRQCEAAFSISDFERLEELNNAREVRSSSH